MNMTLKNITVTKIEKTITFYSEKGKSDRMDKRRSYGLSLCIEGQITYIQNGREYVSRPGTAVILPKGASYVIRRDKTGYFPVINFDCLEFLCDTVTVLPIQNAKELIADFERMNKLSCFEENRARLFSIFYGMLHMIGDENTPHELSGALKMIRNDYCNPTLTNAMLAAECNISEVYFRKLFTKHFGMSPKQFIIDLRIRKAKQLLSEQLLRISEISDNCGFSNPYHFCRLFKLHTGTTPLQYRKSNPADDS
jgi:AraC-like DNA-binding protein